MPLSVSISTGRGRELQSRAVGDYRFDFGIYNGTGFCRSGLRPRFVRGRHQGEGQRCSEFDIIHHGPVFGVSARF